MLMLGSLAGDEKKHTWTHAGRADSIPPVWKANQVATDRNTTSLTKHRI